MKLEQELFKDTDKYIYLDYANNGIKKQAVPLEEVQNIIYIADESLWPEDLKTEAGFVVLGTGLFMQACFSTKNGEIEYCFQNGQNRKGEYVSTLVKVINKGAVDRYLDFFKKRNQFITEDGKLLEAYYLATYKEGKWFVLDKKDRNFRLDCESKEVLSRARQVVF
jgi:hypothetical protein